MICVVIPTFNNAHLIRVILDQVRNLPEFDLLSVVVVDNGSSDDTASVVGQSFPFVHLIRLPENRGGSGGFIAGVEHAMTLNPDYIWMLDDDAEVTGNTLTELLAAVHQLNCADTPWGAIGSMMANLNYPDKVTETGAWLDWKACRFRPYDFKKAIADVDQTVKAVEYCAAASLLTRPDVIRSVGFFENVFIHYDDVEWCLRLTEAGYPVYCAPASVIWHPSQKSEPVTWVRYYDVRNFIWLCLRHNRKWVPWSILRMWIKGSYFYFHRMRKIGRLHFLGIGDALSGRLRMRSDLDVEAFSDMSNVNRQLGDRTAIGVFYSTVQLKQLRESNPTLCEQLQPLFLYEPEHLTGSAAFTTKCRKMINLIRSFLYMLFHPRVPVVFDGECLHHLMFPPLFNESIYVFTRHAKAIMKKRAER